MWTVQVRTAVRRMTAVSRMAAIVAAPFVIVTVVIIAVVQFVVMLLGRMRRWVVVGVIIAAVVVAMIVGAVVVAAVGHRRFAGRVALVNWFALHFALRARTVRWVTSIGGRKANALLRDELGSWTFGLEQLAIELDKVCGTIFRFKRADCGFELFPFAADFLLGFLERLTLEREWLLP